MSQDKTGPMTPVEIALYLSLMYNAHGQKGEDDASDAEICCEP